ncbi:MAG: hypothetical protein ACD_78C00322G0002 [uncultured bacterium (gcode 4)]|uniref:Uncharacterized protein n=1 Tax=uncultured bacterium (gcode 4) TaxID=1234023 RepID=K1XWS6_9BACT|nr:MAG: hypothetical protein ACD_78C00322G0002 [uncultured bacterium (gcode 4)]
MSETIHRPENIGEQLVKLYKRFPLIAGDANPDLLQKIEKFEATLPIGAFWAAIPSWLYIVNSYQKALLKLFEFLKEDYGDFKNYREGKIGMEYLQETMEKIMMMQKLSESQNSDVVMIPVNLLSIAEEHESFGFVSFHLGAFETAVLLLLHREYFQSFGEVKIYCFGDRYQEVDKTAVVRVPYFEIKDGKLTFGTDHMSRVPHWKEFPSAIGFSPLWIRMLDSRIFDSFESHISGFGLTNSGAPEGAPIFLLSFSFSVLFS